ncbi:MAG: T9SS type A sorting domain-containing protein [Candidatus Eisenbacteria bacterium]|nr:T9SS type A sorting domain-containing protein [Candidatus Eisenbacteria bacterium]
MTQADEEAEPGHVYMLQYDDEGGTLQPPSASTEIPPGTATAPVLADLNGDSDPEVFTGSSSWLFVGPYPRDYSLVSVLSYSTGTQEFRGFLDRPLFFWGQHLGPPVISNMDKDLMLETWFPESEALLHCLKYWEEGEELRWSLDQHDERRTGTYETPVSGPYPPGSSVSWWGDYLVTGDVVVDSTSSLRIQPGTTVRVVPNADDQSSGSNSGLSELIVHGELSASGSESSPTSFLSSADSRAPGQWFGMSLQQGSRTWLDGCDVRHAVIGATAVAPETLSIVGCEFEENSVLGISCAGDSGRSCVELLDNTVSSSITGIGLSICDARVEGNTIEDCTTYGMTSYYDEGSQIIGNVVRASSPGLVDPLAGLYVYGSKGDLLIQDNEITDIPDCGIWYGHSGYGDQGMIDGNTIVDNQIFTGSTGMYFDEGCPTVRWNTIDGKKNAFWVESGMSAKPDLGNASTTDGNNSVDASDAKWAVYVRFGPVVKAENNWWGTYRPSGKKFSPLADWQPYLQNPPVRGREGEEGDESEETIPLAAELRNAPNPFNPYTVIGYGLPSEGHVTVAVYDVSGRRVTKLVDSEKPAGWHQVRWSGQNDSGQPVSSGIYFCRLTTGDDRLEKKLALLK